MSLDLTPVHRNLHTKVTFLGLEFEDLILVLALAALMNLLAHFVSGNAHVFGIPLNVFMEFVVPALAVPFLILFKYGRPRGYLTDLVRSFFAPKAWCALERDSELTQAYVVDEEEWSHARLDQKDARRVRCSRSRPGSGASDLCECRLCSSIQ
jgi:hypothetical protein